MRPSRAAEPAAAAVAAAAVASAASSVLLDGRSNPSAKVYCCSAGCSKCGGPQCGSRPEPAGALCCWNQINNLPDNEKYCKTFTDDGCRIPGLT